ncbi:hypothetical protein ACFSY7_15535 [Kurthia populi]|uniref:Uncharacterized protein n=1 Tax=Kurthia populi TaxID=1562132 RepID=A0ABW5Y3R2_9BACL
MNRQTLLKHDNYIIVQHSHYPAMKIYRKKSLTTYHIQKLLAYQKAFDLTDMFLRDFKIKTVTVKQPQVVRYALLLKSVNKTL